MAQWAKVPDVRSDALSLIPGTHTVEGQKRVPQAVLYLHILALR